MLRCPTLWWRCRASRTVLTTVISRTSLVTRNGSRQWLQRITFSVRAPNEPLMTGMVCVALFIEDR